VNVTPITVVASIDPELLENLIDMEEIDAKSIDDCIDESVMEFLESTQERDASVTCYALLRMRPLSISCAECFVVISCGKVDYDKSGWRDD
jgi:hypothetical protein